MTEREILNASLLTAAVIFGVVATYILTGLLGVILAATALDTMLRRIKERRDLATVQAQTHQRTHK